MMWRVLLHEWFVFTALGNILSILNILSKIMVESIWPVSQCEQENNYRDHHLAWIRNESKIAKLQMALTYKFSQPVTLPLVFFSRIFYHDGLQVTIKSKVGERYFSLLLENFFKIIQGVSKNCSNFVFCKFLSSLYS